MNDTPELPMCDADAAPADAKPLRDNRRWTTGDDAHLLDKVHLDWAMDKIAFSLERTTLGCLNRLQRILGAEVPTPAGFGAIVAELKNRAAQAKQVAKTAAKKPPAGGGTGNGAVGRQLSELHKRLGGLERVLVQQGRMRQLALAIELAAGRLRFEVLVAEIGAVAAGQCRRLANDILGHSEPTGDLPAGQAGRRRGRRGAIVTSRSRTSGRDGGLRGLTDSMGLCIRRGGVAGSGPGDLSPTMRIREACRRDRAFAAGDRPLLMDVLGEGLLPARRGGLRRILQTITNLDRRTCLPAGRSDHRHAK